MSLSLPRILVGMCMCVAAGVAQGDSLGVYAGAGTWQQSFSGDVTSGVSTVDIEQDLGLDDDDNVLFFLALEHPIPGLPNVRVQHMSVAVDGNNTLSRTIDFNGTTFTISDDVLTEVDFTQTDAVFYYQLLDNVVSLDLGLAVSQLDGFVSVATALDSARADFDEVIPMVYAKARVDLPLTGFWVGAEGQGISYDDNSLLEYNAQIGWESQIGLGIEAGWRSLTMELDAFDDVEDAELTVKGPYAAINYHF